MGSRRRHDSKPRVRAAGQSRHSRLAEASYRDKFSTLTRFIVLQAAPQSISQTQLRPGTNIGYILNALVLGV